MLCNTEKSLLSFYSWSSVWSGVRESHKWCIGALCWRLYAAATLLVYFITRTWNNEGLRIGWSRMWIFVILYRYNIMTIIELHTAPIDYDMAEGSLLYWLEHMRSWKETKRKEWVVVADENLFIAIFLSHQAAMI